MLFVIQRLVYMRHSKEWGRCWWCTVHWLW